MEPGDHSQALAAHTWALQLLIYIYTYNHMIALLLSDISKLFQYDIVTLLHSYADKNALVAQENSGFDS